MSEFPSFGVNAPHMLCARCKQFFTGDTPIVYAVPKKGQWEMVERQGPGHYNIDCELICEACKVNYDARNVPADMSRP